MLFRSVIGLGSRVVLQEEGSKQKLEFTLVSSVEAKIKDQKISDESPVGKALIGQKKGFKITVSAPIGKIKYKILQVN